VELREKKILLLSGRVASDLYVNFWFGVGNLRFPSSPLLLSGRRMDCKLDGMLLVRTAEYGNEDLAAAPSKHHSENGVTKTMPYGRGNPRRTIVVQYRSLVT
jgi:hypothetical protein